MSKWLFTLWEVYLFYFMTCHQKPLKPHKTLHTDYWFQTLLWVPQSFFHCYPADQSLQKGECDSQGFDLSWGHKQTQLRKWSDPRQHSEKASCSTSERWSQSVRNWASWIASDQCSSWGWCQLLAMNLKLICVRLYMYESQSHEDGWRGY